MHVIDYALVAAYLIVLLYLGLRGGRSSTGNVGDFILDGRRLTLPAFVASLVSTWYGGILGVGEYSFQYGISNWLVFGVPYYVAALLFAFFLARKARQLQLLTIPERLAQVYDNKTALAGAVVVFLMTVPAAYILILGVLCEFFFGWPLWTGVILGTIFSLVYVYYGAFRSVVRTDIFQFILMFVGFTALLLIVVNQYGGIEFLTSNLPSSHFTWHGGNTGWYIAVWYVIALATLVEPSFYQRCYAAKSPQVAYRGIFISVLCWIIFDFLTTACGLYARAILPATIDPVASYPALAVEILPAGLLGLFAVALLSTVMSTVDSYSFLAASTFGNDIVPVFRKVTDSDIIRYTRIGLVISTLLAVVGALFFRSVVDIWYAFGSIGTSALLVPVFFSFVGKRLLPGRFAFLSIIVSGSISSVWYASKYINADESFWLGVQPIFPGLLFSLAVFALFSKANSRPLLQRPTG